MLQPTYQLAARWCMLMLCRRGVRGSRMSATVENYNKHTGFFSHATRAGGTHRGATARRQRCWRRLRVGLQRLDGGGPRQ
jgi:hypothetical protein